MDTNEQVLNLANGITLKFTPSIKDFEVVWNVIGFNTSDPSNITHAFGRDLSPEKLFKEIFNTFPKSLIASGTRG